MATAYLAIQKSLERAVVLKVSDRFEPGKADELAERFIDEGRILASLTHPNIITIYDIGIANHLFYISMEYVQGGDLKRRLELPISADEALTYLEKITAALDEAHKHGIVHRDVKPANILFRDENTPLLTDFGIAKHMDTKATLTSTGLFLGSPNYVSPEQADGFTTDGRADIYSLGCIFYEMLIGEKPYRSDKVIDVVIQHKQAPIPTLPAEFKAFQSLLNQMLAKRRNERVPDAEKLLLEIKRLQKTRNTHLAADLDITTQRMKTQTEVRGKRARRILLSLIAFGLVLFSSLKYIEVRIKQAPDRLQQATTKTVLNGQIQLPGQNTTPVATTGESTVGDTQTGDTAPAPEEVKKALAWLGRQCLEEYKLTYPPKDNAFYYFSRLLEVEPGNQLAINGIYEIADRYATLAEQTLARDEPEKILTYIDIGLKINPDHPTLLALRELASTQEPSFMGKLKSLF